MQLAEDPSTEVRAMAATYASSAGHLFKLARDSDPGVRVKVARNISTPGDALLAVARDGNEDVRFAVANSGWSTDEALSILRRDSSERVRSAAKERLHDREDRDDGDVLGALGRDVRELLGSGTADDDEIQRTLARTAVLSADLPYDDGPRVRARLRLSRQTWLAPKTLRALAAQPYREVREAVASNPATPAKVLGKLCDESSDVGDTALSNPSTPPETLKFYVQNTRLLGRFIGEIVLANPSVPVRSRGVRTGLLAEGSRRKHRHTWGNLG